MKSKKMNETSWRTLMLLTTLFIVFVIFQGTVRTPKLPAAKAKAQPLVAIHIPQEPNQLPPDANQPEEHPPHIQPQPVTTFVESRPVWLRDNLGDLNGTDWSSESDPEESEDPNQPAGPVE